MSFDGLVTYCITDEISNLLTQGKIEKIHQPNRDEIVITVRANQQSHKLLISANTSRARVLITEKKYENPQSPPMFCMLLRKHIAGGTILSIEQKYMDRVIEFQIKSYDDLGNLTAKRLIVELMGKYSNIILVDGNGVIIDSIKRIYADMSSVREVLPGYDYIEPQRQDKLDIFSFTKDDFIVRINNLERNTKIKRVLYNVFEGLGPLISSEIIFRSDIDENKTVSDLSEDEIHSIYMEMENMQTALKDKSFKPSIYYKDEAALQVNAFYCFSLNQFGSTAKKSFDTMSECLENVYDSRDKFDAISQLSSNIKKLVSNNINKLNRKLQKQKEELLESQDREIIKIYADILSSNLHLKKPAEKSIELDNYYDPDYKKIVIPLDEKLSLSGNAQKYYKKYSKMKNRENKLMEEIPKVEFEVEYLENVLHSLDNITTVSEIQDVKDELVETGYLEQSSGKKKVKRPSKSTPHKYLSSENFTIFVGKNNRQNDELTTKIANQNDIWLHIREMPGSHVIIKTEDKEVPERTLLEAAFLAKYYSKAKFLNSAAVDYTERRNVKKIRGGKPGMVNYKNFKTIFPTDEIKLSDITQVE